MSVFPTRIRWRSVWAAARRRAAAARCLQTRRATAPARTFATTPPQHGLDDVGSANLDWPRLGFDFQKTNGFVKHTWVNGKWDDGEWEPEPFLKLHVMSAAIHYGQGVYEGAKAHHCKDGSVRLWNIQANAHRMLEGCERMMMPAVPPEMFIRACEWCVAANRAYIPPYGTGGALYLRPYIFGHGPQLGLSAAPQFHFCVLAMPVSSYYAGGLQPTSRA